MKRWYTARNWAAAVLLVCTAVFYWPGGNREFLSRILAFPMFVAMTVALVYHLEILSERSAPCQHQQRYCSVCMGHQAPRPVRGQVICAAARSISKLKPRGP